MKYVIEMTIECSQNVDVPDHGIEKATMVTKGRRFNMDPLEAVDFFVYVDLHNDQYAVLRRD